jgi:hypothetical protein
MRHTYQHRRPLEGVTVHFAEHDHLTRARLGLVDITQLPDVTDNIAKVPGIVALHDRLFLVPDCFQRSAIAHGAAIINHVLAAGTWTDSDWLDLTESREADRRQAGLRDEALRQFGTLLAP